MPRFRYTLRGLLLVTTLLAVSFSLYRTGLLAEQNTVLSVACMFTGVHLFAVTVGGAVGFLFVGTTKGTVIGAIVSVLLLWALLLFALVQVMEAPVMRQ